MNLNKKVDLWEKAGVITAGQKEQILNFEMKEKKPVFLYALLGLGAFCIGLGLISIIASNWAEIPASTKLIFDFLLLAGTIWGITYACDNRKTFLKEALILFYAIMSLASIGLVAQIYHLPPNGLMALFFWSIITAPLLFFTKKTLFPFIWIVVFIFSFLDVLDKNEVFHYYITTSARQAPALAFMVIIYLMAADFQLIEKFFKKEVPNVVTAYENVIITALAIYTPFLESSFRRYYAGYLYGDTYHPYILQTFWLVSILTLGYLYISLKNKHKYILYALCLIAVGCAGSMFLSMPHIIEDIWSAAFTLSMLAIAGIYAYKTNNTKLINIVSFLIAARFLIIYFDVFGSLMATGFGLITSGAVFLGIAYIWNQTRKTIITQIKEKK